MFFCSAKKIKDPGEKLNEQETLALGMFHNKIVEQTFETPVYTGWSLGCYAEKKKPLITSKWWT